MILVSMLPIYIFGNLHCMGMCGPLVMLIGKHRFRYFYFLGRISSFTLAGFIAGGMGSVLNVALQQYNLSAIISFVFGTLIILVGGANMTFKSIPMPIWIRDRSAKMSRSLSILMLKDQPFATFLFGFFTIALPCGQTLLVYSACALSGDLMVGGVNGFFFALLTSPSLFLAMRAHRLFSLAKKYNHTIIGSVAVVVGLLALLRGAAEMGWIPHLVLYPHYFVLY